MQRRRPRICARFVTTLPVVLSLMLAGSTASAMPSSFQLFNFSKANLITTRASTRRSRNIRSIIHTKKGGDPTPSPTTTPTPTSSPTATPTVTATATPTVTATATPTVTATATPTVTATATPTVTATATPTVTATATPTVTATATPTATPSSSPNCNSVASPSNAQSVLSSAQQGQTVCLADGTYGMLTFTKSGVTLAAVDALAAHVAGINLNGQSNLTVMNLDVDGSLPNAFTWGIVSTGGSNFTITGNSVENFQAGGIAFDNADHIVIQHNVVSYNASVWTGSASGISLFQNVASDSAPGWHNIVSYNQSFNNCNPKGGTDGNGIIIDDFAATSYSYPTLVEENLTWSNCGAGIKDNNSAGVTIRNNTNWQNHTETLNTFTWRGEIDLEYSINAIVANNIDCPNTSFNSNNTAILDAGTSTVKAANIDCTETNPMLVSAPSNLQLQSDSPAIGGGTSVYGVPAAYFDGTPISSAPDIGAY
jgi:hypothetical protein